MVSSGSWDRIFGGSSRSSNRSASLPHPEANTVPCGEELPRVFLGVAFEILLHIGGGIGSSLDCDDHSVVYQWLLQTCEGVRWRG